jgi:hypothetical protein
MTENENKAPATEAQQELAQASEGKAEASVELSEDDLEAVAGGNDVAGGGGVFVGRAPWRR